MTIGNTGCDKCHRAGTISTIQVLLSVRSEGFQPVEGEYWMGIPPRSNGLLFFTSCRKHFESVARGDRSRLRLHGFHDISRVLCTKFISFGVD